MRWLLLACSCLLGSVSNAQTAGGITRTYYVAAEDTSWDYAPGGADLMMGQPFTAADSLFAVNSPGRVGSVYRKARYVAYTDASFETRESIPPAWEHKGILGPVFRAAVGDTIRVVFRNNASRPYSIHPHGVFYTKANEGSMTNDGTRGAERDDDRVPPGGTYTYTWPVPERAGPGPSDPSSIVWVYHSHVDPVRDVNTGLVGVIIVTAKGMATAEGAPLDVDREFVSLFNVFDENVSWHVEENAERATHEGDLSTVQGWLDDPDFTEGNLMHGINGYVYGSLPMMRMIEGEHVRWYLVGMGSEVDLHTPHWHGNTVLWQGHRMDTVSLLPAVVVTADMIPDNPGIWMYHCHVNDHIAAGMTGRYEVLPGE